MSMRCAFSLVVLAVFLPNPMRALAQMPEERTFGCGTIRVSSSGKSMTYTDLGRGFRFEFPLHWVGRQGSLYNPSIDPRTESSQYPSHITVNARLVATDTRFYVSQGARVTGTETANGLEWTALILPNGWSGYYAYRDGVAIEFVVSTYGESRVPSAATLAGLKQMLSSFSLLDGGYRVDRQFSALQPGQKLGSLTIERILPGTGGSFGGNLGRVEFSGQLTLTGMVMLEGTMGGGRSGFYISSLESGSLALMPLLKCPVDEAPSPFAVRVSFRNQDFAEEQFGRHNWYEARGTVVVDNVIETYYNGFTRPSISARLLNVVEKKPIE